MKVYVGLRGPDRTAKVFAVEGLDQVELDPRLDLWNHSPTGLEWGYGGSGPAQLALALLADALEHDLIAVALHQQFKAEVISGLPRDWWSMDEDTILRWALFTLGEAMADDEARLSDEGDLYVF